MGPRPVGLVSSEEGGQDVDTGSRHTAEQTVTAASCPLMGLEGHPSPEKAQLSAQARHSLGDVESPSACPAKPERPRHASLHTQPTHRTRPGSRDSRQTTPKGQRTNHLKQCRSRGSPRLHSDKGTRPPRRQRKPPGNIRGGIPLAMATNSSCYHIDNNNNSWLKPISPSRETL